ncbi:PaaI family thioesterase [Pseudodesulfovibrio indicus]|uniref:Thioesterase n=1 Tax=Pseudodesulfovibrio indicus TaxID=1716143 RepID=A0A140D9A6_9BACT|nr:PaaI family thioesterase [Pseudodesulfovibrio indicus]AMK09773.1 thioesterase [Pseudodesulfovibrio indicus]TDT86266.1 acyl-coenzyme A thioesterase PaaI-like protein [Pseudodesulfovibrio indicus]
MSEMTNPFPDGTCFFCGPNNPSGLKLTFHRDGEGGVYADYTPESIYCGQGDIFHGGLQMGLLDEAMWWAGYEATGIMEAVTASASFRFLRPVYIGSPIRAACALVSREGNALRLRGSIRNAEGKVCTSVRGEYRIIPRERYETVLAARP